MEIWNFENDRNKAYTGRLSFLKNIIWQYSVESDETPRITAVKDIINNYINKSTDNLWLCIYCGYCQKEARHILLSYNDTRSRITPEISKFICKMQDSNIPIEKRLQELYESKFTDEDKKLIARQTSSWFNKFVNILGLDRCYELNYNISDIVRETLFIEYKDEISVVIYRYFKVGNIYSKKEISKQLLEIFGQYGICNVSFDLIEFIKNYFEINEINTEELEFLKRTSIFKRRYSSLNSQIETRENASIYLWYLSNDIYKEFSIGKTYDHSISRSKIMNIYEKHGMELDYTFNDPEDILRCFFKIAIYETTVSSKWATDRKQLIDGAEIDILEKLNPPSEQD